MRSQSLASLKEQAAQALQCGIRDPLKSVSSYT
jgi:hypothetical protein